MIESSTKPSQILVIDDNQLWLNTLENIGLQVFCCQNTSMMELKSFLFVLKGQLKYVIVNSCILLSPKNQRQEYCGISLVEGFLKLHFPELNFLYISFIGPDDISPSINLYTDFLFTINTFGSREV